MEEDLRKKDYKRQIEEEKEAKREAEKEKMRKYREELAAFYQKEEEEAIKRGDVVEELIEEYKCEICRKTFKS